jgi:ABC-type uncharacterized transport system ATPase component
MGIFGKTEHHNETIIVKKESVGAAVAKGLLDSGKTTQEDVEVRRLQMQSEADHMAQIHAVRLEGQAEELSASLNTLFAMYQGKHPGDSEKESKKAIREKIDYGIMKLQKLDAADASFFQKKFDAISLAEKNRTKRNIIIGIVVGLVLIGMIVIPYMLDLY